MVCSQLTTPSSCCPTGWSGIEQRPEGCGDKQFESFWPLFLLPGSENKSLLVRLPRLVRF